MTFWSLQWHEPGIPFLTQAAIEKFSPPTAGRAYDWDRHLPGFGLRVTPNGAKSWIASYRLADRRKVMETIATLARLPKIDERKGCASRAKCCGVTGRIVVQANMGAIGAIMKYGSQAPKRLAADLAAAGAGDGLPETTEAAQAKIFTSEMAIKVTNDAFSCSARAGTRATDGWSAWCATRVCLRSAAARRRSCARLLRRGCSA